jgi:PQQ-dependent dehydrogenase (methanol/ethanol family)
MKQQRLSILVGAAAAATIGLCGTAVAQTGQALEPLMAKSSNWAAQAGDYANHRYSDLKQIDSSNVAQLQVAWTMSTGVLRGHEGSPLVIGDTLYLHTPFPNNVYAVNLKDQSFKWKYEPKQNTDVVPVMCCDTVNRGLAYGNGKILLQQADTTLVALDANTGKVVWTAKNGDPKIGETNTNAPHVFKDKVITGISGGEFGVRGRLIAYDLNTGKKVWTAWSTGPDAELLVDPDKTMTWTNGKLAPIGKDSSIKTWKGDQWKLGGGTTWGWYAYDPKLNLVYYGTGNPGTWNPAQRPGDNRWSMTIFARDLNTGMAKWAYQMTPHDEWDFDGVNEMLLVDLQIKGKTVPSVVHFDRNGFGYTLNRETGELLVAQKYDPKVNWASSVDMKTGRPIVDKKYSPGTTGPDVNVKDICPAALGSKDQQPASYDRKSGLIMVPTNHVCMTYEPFQVEYTAGQPFVGATLTMYPTPGSHGGMGNFIAWDAAQGKIVWSKPERFSVWSGALTTAGDIVFYGTLEGYIKAVSTKDGKELWKFKTPSGIIGNVFTYEYGGKQYVGTYSGIGGWAGIGMAAGLTGNTEGLGAVGGYKDLAKYTTLGGALFVFALPDSARTASR